MAFFVVHSFIEIRPLPGEFPVAFPFFFLQWNHRRCALSKLRVEMRRNWKGGPTYKKGRTTRTRGSMKRFDVGYTLRKKGWSNDLLARRRTLCLLFIFLSQPTRDMRVSLPVPIIISFSSCWLSKCIRFCVALLASSDPCPHPLANTHRWV